jgi:hypothetical protein
MSQKPNMSVTSRFQAEQRPLASRSISSPFPNPPPNRTALPRLSFHGPSPKMDCSAEDIARAIGVYSLPNAVIFPDTNVFSKEMDMAIWDAFWKRRIRLTPLVFNELQPWLKTPFRNKSVRDRVQAELNTQRSLDASRNQHVFSLLPSEMSRLRVLNLNYGDEFMRHGCDYYFKLLSLRKLLGPMATRILTERLGRPPTNDEFVAEVQRQFGPRGLLLAKNGLQCLDSAGKLSAARMADEQLVVMAVVTAIVRGTEVIIVTRDPDVLEQYFKLLNLIKEHYRSMLIADYYAAHPDRVAFKEVPIETDGTRVSPFTGRSVLRLETTDANFNPLPRKFHFVCVYCFLLADGPTKMKLTQCSFCAETEMAEVLRVKARTGGLSTDKFDGRNCTIVTSRLTPTDHKVTVSIGRETPVPMGPMGTFGFDDYQNTIFEKEETTHFEITS